MKPKKSLGQNFLKDTTVLEKIIKAADLKADDFVIEVGPGQGTLTKELIKHAGKIVAIEIDKSLAEQLKIKYKTNKKIEILYGDILKINLPELIIRHSEIRQSGVKNLLNNTTSSSGRKILRPADRRPQDDGTDYKVVANIPYYITSPIIQLFLETEFPPKEMILMVQKEVAERICSKPGNMSILAVSVQYYAKPELLFYVPRTAFWPAPEVDSAVIKIEVISKNKEVSSEERKRFFRVVKAGFCAKRKVLSNNLSSSFHISKQEAEIKIKKAGIDPSSRAQELSIDDWKKMEKLF